MVQEPMLRSEIGMHIKVVNVKGRLGDWRGCGAEKYWPKFSQIS